MKGEPCNASDLALACVEREEAVETAILRGCDMEQVERARTDVRRGCSRKPLAGPRQAAEVNVLGQVKVSCEVRIERGQRKRLGLRLHCAAKCQ